MINWIDRAEEVPGHDGWVLVTVEQADGDRFVSISCYLDCHDQFQNEYHDALEGCPDAFKVVAWAELPEPWRGGRNNGIMLQMWRWN